MRRSLGEIPSVPEKSQKNLSGECREQHDGSDYNMKTQTGVCRASTGGFD
jgi:hypothetical protein